MRSPQNYSDNQEHTLECLIKGKRIPYDICSSDTLENAKKSMGDKFKYLGSGRVYFRDGVEKKTELTHFFAKI